VELIISTPPITLSWLFCGENEMRKINSDPVKGLRKFFESGLNPDSLSDQEYRSFYETLVRAELVTITECARYKAVVTRNVIEKCSKDERVTLAELQTVTGLKYVSVTNRLARNGESSKNLKWSTSKTLQSIIEKTW